MAAQVDAAQGAASHDAAAQDDAAHGFAAHPDALHCAAAHGCASQAADAQGAAPQCLAEQAEAEHCLTVHARPLHWANAAPGTAAANPPATMNMDANFVLDILESLMIKGLGRKRPSPHIQSTTPFAGISLRNALPSPVPAMDAAHPIMVWAHIQQLHMVWLHKAWLHSQLRRRVQRRNQRLRNQLRHMVQRRNPWRWYQPWWNHLLRLPARLAVNRHWLPRPDHQRLRTWMPGYVSSYFTLPIGITDRTHNSPPAASICRRNSFGSEAIGSETGMAIQAATLPGCFRIKSGHLSRPPPIDLFLPTVVFVTVERKVTFCLK